MCTLDPYTWKEVPRLGNKTSHFGLSDSHAESGSYAAGAGSLISSIALSDRFYFKWRTANKIPLDKRTEKSQNWSLTGWQLVNSLERASNNRPPAFQNVQSSAFISFIFDGAVHSAQKFGF